MVFILKKLYQQEYNKECNDWVELGDFRPKVGEIIESANLYLRGKGKSKWGKKSEKNTEPNATESDPSSSSNQGSLVQGAVAVASKAAEPG